jgi:hypothetical protein
MGLGLLVPAFLAALAALVVPIVLHLRHRDKDTPLKFPSLMFLEHLPIRTAERRRITDWPLLLLRALLLTLLVLAFARPVFSRPVVTERTGQSRAVVVALDRSMSMSHRDVWPAALDSARRVISSLGAGDKVAIVLFDDEAEIVQTFTADLAAARAVLDRTKPGARGTRYAAALRAARQLATNAGDAKAEIVIVTDLQRSGVSGVAGLDLPKGLPMRIAAVSPASRANSAIVSAIAQPSMQGQRRMLTVQARAISREGAAPRRVRATLRLNGRPSGARDLDLPASGEASIAFAPALLPAGLVRGEIAIDQDALAADDTFHFAYTGDDAMKVLLVAPDDASGEETLFLERALAVGRAPTVRVERTRRSGVDERALDGTSLVILWDEGVPSGGGGRALTDWVRKGGGLVVVAGRRLGTSITASGMMPAAVGGTTDRLSDRGGSFGDVRMDHPLFLAFRDAPATLNAARFLRYRRLQPATGAEVLARFDDGLPAVVERREGAGRVVLVGAPMDTRSGDFPLQPAYLPFLQRLVMHTSGRDAVPLWRTTGQSWLLPGTLREPAVSAPSGDIVRPKRDTAGSTLNLREAGIHALYDGPVQGEPLALVAANAPPSESDLAAVAPGELLLGVRQTAAAATTTTELPTATEIEGRQRFWRILLIAAVLLLLAETIMANRGWRARAVGAPRAGPQTERSLTS